MNDERATSVPNSRTIAITGATGYIGGATVRLAVARGLRVIALGRRPLDDHGVDFSPYDLHDDGPIDVLAECAAVIHLAADTSARSRANVEFEVRAAARLVDASRKHGVHLVYVSSQTAHADAPSEYGRSKWAVEQVVHAAAGAIVRPGLVYGGEERGMFGMLCDLVRSSPCLPAFLPAARVQPIHVDELAAALLSAAQTRLPATWSLGREEPVSFTAFLRLLAGARVRPRRFFLPFPVHLLFLAEPLISRAMPRGPDLRQLRSLYATPRMRTADDLKAAGIEIRPLCVGMRRGGNGRRRALLGEASTMLAYVLRSRAPASMLRRYARAAEILDAGVPLTFPHVVSQFPLLLAFLDGASLSESKFAMHLSWAVRIGEASPIGSRRFLPISATYRPIRALFTVGFAILCGIGFRLLGIAFSGATRRLLRSLDQRPA